MHAGFILLYNVICSRNASFVVSNGVMHLTPNKLIGIIQTHVGIPHDVFVDCVSQSSTFFCTHVWTAWPSFRADVPAYAWTRDTMLQSWCLHISPSRGIRRCNWCRCTELLRLSMFYEYPVWFLNYTCLHCRCVQLVTACLSIKWNWTTSKRFNINITLFPDHIYKVIVSFVLILTFTIYMIH